MQRYKDIVALLSRTPNSKKSYETLYYPEFELKSTDIYIITSRLDRMDLLADDHYGDPRFWWVIQRANSGLPYGTMVLPAGLRIRIPSPYTSYDIYELMKSKQF